VGHGNAYSQGRERDEEINKIKDDKRDPFVHTDKSVACMISFEDFENVDIRVGRVQSVEPFPEGRYSTHVLKIDFGEEFGVKKSLAKLAPLYEGPELVGRQVVCVVNFPPKQIGPHKSEVLTLGMPDADGNAVLLHPEREVPLGGKLF